MQTMKVSVKHVLLLFLIAAAVLILPGSDIYTHTHEAWLYNYMIQNEVILQKDFSLLSGRDPLYGYGVISYTFAGFAWFLFNNHVIKALEVVLLIGIALASMRTFANKGILYFWYSLIFYKIIQPDSYPYLFSVFLFYLGVFFIKKFKDKWYGDAAIIIAGLNHPYVALANLWTVFFNRKNLFVVSVIVVFAQFIILKFVFFAGLVNFSFADIFHLAERSLVLLFPFIAECMPERITRFFNLRTAYAVLIIALAIYFFPVFPTPYESGLKELHCYYRQDYSQVPQLEGNLRVVDQCRGWTYIFPLRGAVLSESSAFQGQYYGTKWTKEKYMSYLAKSNTSFVIFCKNCSIKTTVLQGTGEFKLLKENFPAYADMQDFIIFDVRNASEINVNATKKKNHFLSGIAKQLHNLTV